MMSSWCCITSQVQRNNIKINTINTDYAYIQQHSNIKNKTTQDHQHINQEEDGGLKKKVMKQFDLK